MPDSDKSPDKKPLASPTTRESMTGISRRQFLVGGSALGLAAGLGPWVITAPRARAAGKRLKLLQWSHFVPSYDKWFDNFAKSWGEENDVEVSVDHISITELTTTLSSEISAGSGHDLIELGPEAAQFEPALIALDDLNEEIRREFGQPFSVAKRVSYSPATKHYYAFCHGWTADPGDYRKSLWQTAGLAGGPRSWQDLARAGGEIKRKQGVQVGIGMSQDIDSNMAARAVLWSFDTAVQDQSGAVILDQGVYYKRAVEAVKYLKHLYEQALTPEIFAWNAASNNQALIAGRASFILNSISAYRSAQEVRPDIAKDIFFTPALQGPQGTRWANVHVLYNYVLPKFAQANAPTAKAFIKHLVANYDMAIYQSKLYNSPSYFDTPIPQGDRGYPPVAGAKTLQELTDAWFDNDPFKLPGEASGKLRVLKDAVAWTTNLGHPGYANPAIGEVFNTFLIPNMVANIVRGQDRPEAAIKRAAAQARDIFAKWRKRGLV
ncbi:MAG TPA: ABC transporter substrate-binding protein [Nitrococcus sp.]|nr:ABC transporter substrate-binding protein [Nitrococcus sp.]